MRLPLTFSALAVLATAPAALGADRIFDIRVLHETRIEMAPDDWQALRDNFRTNQYYAANVSFDGELVEQVGVRSRGKGSRSDTKPGLRLDFNRFAKGRDFHGMKSAVLDNEVQDTSVLREVLAYDVFQAMGIAAPQVAYARVTVNGEYWGVYAQTEDVRKSFLLERFGEDTGNLFSYEWGGAYDLSWRGEDEVQYVPVPFEPQTNEDSLDSTELIDFIRAVNEAPEASFVAEISNYLDIEKFLTYLAVENAIAESDGFLGDQGMNNYYLYQRDGGSRFEVIPWDKDNAFQAPQWPLFRGVEGNLLVSRLLNVTGLRGLYVAAVQRAVRDFVNTRYLTPRLEANYRLIREAVLQDTKKPYSNDEFELAVVGLRGVIASREPDVSAQLRSAAVRP